MKEFVLGVVVGIMAAVAVEEFVVRKIREEDDGLQVSPYLNKK